MKKLITQKQYNTAVGESVKWELGDWLDKQDLMLLLHISSRTLQNWRNKKTLPFAKIGRKIYYRKTDVMELLLKSIEV